MRRALATPFIVLAIAIGTSSALADHSGPTWRPARNPPTLVRLIDASVWPDDVALAAANWSNGSVAYNVERGECIERRGYVVLCSFDADPSVGLGGGLQKEAGNRIVGVIIRLNQNQFAMINDSVRPWILCHELGHALGLLHDDVAPDNPDAEEHHGCMNTRWQGAAFPSPHDVAELALRYG